VLGALPDAAALHVTVALKPRDPAALAAYATGVSTPGSSSFHDYLSVAQFAQRFGATAQQVAAVRASLRAHGLSPGPATPNGLAIPVASTAGTLARAFSTGFQRVALPDGRKAFANARAPLLDAGIAGLLEGVIGLDDLAVPQPQAIPRAGAAGAAGAAARAAGARTGTGSARTAGPTSTSAHVATGGPQPCPTAASAAASLPITYTADQIASAYGFGSLYGAGDEGAGQTIAVYELEASIPSDITAYEQCYGISGATVSYVKVDGGPAPLDVSNSDGLETSLDVESVLGLAPKANVIVYQGPDSVSNAPGAGAFDTYNQIVSQDKANVIATSWGVCEPDEGSADARAEYFLFLEAAAQGETVVSASGDSGSADCFSSDNSKSLAVDDPSSQPFVTSVGGTSLTLGPPRNETVWNDTAGATGGGISSLWPMPAYQSSAPTALHVINPSSSPTPCSAPSGDCREVPDVAGDADPETGVLVYWDGNGSASDAGGWDGFGGTSATAPIWAALLALTNASSACAGSPIGFANPALYRAAASAYSANFNDVLSGTNNLAGAGPYPAGSGYDMATGLGTPIASSLPAALCEHALALANPGAQSTYAGAAVSLHVHAADEAGATVSYGAKALPPGLTIDSATGVISGRPQTAGSYAVVVSAEDSDSSLASTSFTWTVAPSVVAVIPPGRQTGTVGAAVHVQLLAWDLNGGALKYAATGLPRGLSVGRNSGLISGTPSRAGTARTTISVTDVNGGSTSAELNWTINRPPRLSHASLSGLAAGRPRLAFTVSTTGSAALKLVAIALGLPRGLSFASKAAGHIYVRTPSGGRLGFGDHGGGRSLTIKFGKPLAIARIVIAEPALRADSGIVGRLRRHEIRELDVGITPTDAAGSATRLKLKTTPS
jgi:hypothetical protein